jgi:hypothetical protein
MGKTWEPVRRIDKKIGMIDRPRIWSVRFLKGEDPWWPEDTLIGVGDLAVIDGSSKPRQNSLWYSRDGGDTWKGPYAFDVVTEDAGYGDVLYDDKRDVYHFFSYHGSQTDADLVQYRFKLKW